MRKVGVVIGSKSDFSIVQGTIEILEEFQIPFEVHVLSAHRCPDEVRDFAATAYDSGFFVLIAAAGMAAHLAGALASNTALPIIGIPLRAKNSDGLDALLSTVMMPPGVPVATVSIDGAKNAALLAIQILATSDKELYQKLIAYKQKTREEVLKIDQEINQKYKGE